jgi:hypothetical protein
LRLKDAPRKILVLIQNQLNISIHTLEMEGICIIHSVLTSKGNSLTFQENTMEIKIHKIQSKYVSTIAIIKQDANHLKKLINSCKILGFNCIIIMNIWTLANTEINQYKSTLSILKLCTCLLLAKTPYSKFGLKYKSNR